MKNNQSTRGFSKMGQGGEFRKGDVRNMGDQGMAEESSEFSKLSDEGAGQGRSLGARQG